jgi:chorismate mutase/prephenate dehydratase
LIKHGCVRTAPAAAVHAGADEPGNGVHDRVSKAAEARASRAKAEARSALSALRARLDALDARLLETLTERYRVVQKVRQAKAGSGDGVYIPGRERAQLERLERLNREAGGVVPREALRAIFGEVLSASRAMQEQGPPAIAHLGPPGTFSEKAARQQFGSSSRFVPVPSIPDVFRAVEQGDAQFGVVPIENSTEGMVIPTLDALVATPLKIVAAFGLRIRHALLARSRSLTQVKRIVSHPQSFGQCRAWLARNAPGIPTEEVSSNALAGEIAARSSTTAAIAGREVAERYALHVLADNIQDLVQNVTRFVVLAPADTPLHGNEDKVSVLFSVRNEAGMLYRCLQPLARHKIDLYKLESRPMRGRSWEYLFFADFGGQVDAPPVKRAMAAMARHCMWFKVLGAYAETQAA